MLFQGHSFMTFVTKIKGNIRISGFPRSWKTWKSHGISFSNSRPGKVLKFGENEKSHGKVMEFHFPEKKKINNQELQMTVAIWVKNKQLEQLLLPEKGHGFFIIWSWKVMEKSWNLIVLKVQEP